MMKLQFDKGGRRFFFLTFAVRGRRPVLSRIVEKPGRDGAPGWGVALLPPGEAVAALWRGVHARWPFLTASNFVIMPDHVHLLLIADYSRAPTFDILDWFQHFRREGEEAVEQHGPEIERMVGLARLGWLPVCGFLSPGEKELERRLRAEPYARWIKTVAHGLPPRFDPTVEDSRFLAEGRQLFLSSFADDVPVFPVNYDNCHIMNARNEALCARAAAGGAAL